MKLTFNDGFFILKTVIFPIPPITKEGRNWRLEKEKGNRVENYYHESLGRETGTNMYIKTLELQSHLLG